MPQAGYTNVGRYRLGTPAWQVLGSVVQLEAVHAIREDGSVATRAADDAAG